MPATLPGPGASGSSPAGAIDGPAELHLVVIWSAARRQEKAILADLQDHLEVRRVHEVHWSPDLVRQNYARFYRGRLMPPYRNVRLRKGNGPLLVVTALDRAPRYAMRDTLHGPALVNSTLFDAKIRYRSWTGPGHLVHGSDTAAEAARDLMLLLGAGTGDYLERHPGAWDGAILSVRRDLSGARGWESAAALFTALNCSVDYVVLSGAEALREGSDGHAGEALETVELLTDNYIELIAVTNGRPLLRQIPRWGGRFAIRIRERDVAFGFRRVGDRYLDPAWERAVLDRREPAAEGFFRPAAEDAFEALAYHALIHRRSLSERHKNRLEALAGSLGRTGWTRAALDDRRRTTTLVRDLLAERGYACVRPRDRLVFYDFRAAGARLPGLGCALADVEAAATRRCNLWCARARVRYFQTRDALARAAPWARALLRRRHRRSGFQPPTLPERRGSGPPPPSVILGNLE